MIDRTRPIASAPRVSLASDVALLTGVAGIPATVTWTATDPSGSGIAGHDLRVSRDGAAFVDLATGLTSSSLGVLLAAGHRYRFEVRATDGAGNIGAWAVGPTISAAIVQEFAPAILLHGTWETEEAGWYLGGAAISTTSAGASVRVTFTGRAIAWVSLGAPDHGAVRVYVDGALVATIDTHALTPTTRWVAWSRSWPRQGTHAVTLVAVGTAGHPRVDLDAFEVLR